MPKTRLTSLSALTVPMLLAVACGGAKETGLFGAPETSTSTSPTDPSGTSVGSGGDDATSSSSSGQSSSGQSSSSSSSSGSTSSSSSSSSSSSGGVKDAGTVTPTGSVRCGSSGSGSTTACTATTEVCCAYFGNGPLDLACEPSGPTACMDGITIACDDRTDCPANEVCCGTLEDNSGYSSVECRPTCVSSPGVRAVRFCDPKAVPSECPNGSVCGQSQSLPGFYVCKS